MTTVRNRTHAMAEPTARRTETHQRILDAAGRLFRRNGIDGVGVDAVMKEAGLTHGGFYAHFASKDALVAEVVRTLLEKSAGNWNEISRTEPPAAALERIVLSYLDPDKVASGIGCLLTSLGPEVARRSAARSAIGVALSGMVEALTRVSPGRRRDRALASLSTLVGAVVLARLADHPALAQDILDAAAASIVPDRVSAPG
jgi:TetR/AcrR family transcriptional repressor of nem operon